MNAISTFWIMLMFSSICTAQDAIRDSDSRWSPNGKFELNAIMDEQGNPSLTIRNIKGNPIFTEEQDEPHWVLSSVNWRPDSKFVAVTSNVNETDDEVSVYQLDKKTFVPINFLTDSPTSKFTRWFKNGDLELLLIDGFQRRNEPGDIISEHTVVMRFKGNPVRARIISQSKVNQHTYEEW